MVNIMNVEFVSIENVRGRGIVEVKAGKYDDSEEQEQIIFLKFFVNIQNIKADKCLKFTERVMDYKSCCLDLGDGQTIKYDYKQSMITFNLIDITVSLINTFAPECLREELCNLLEDEEDNESDEDKKSSD
jgi:hypothetical protein